MANAGWRAMALAEIHGGMPVWHNLCLKRARTLLGVPAKFGSAIAAWNATAKADRHPGDHPPRGVPVFWSVGRFGHVAVSDGGGWCFSTDIKRRGRLDRVPIALIHQRWGATYLGWSETLNGVRVYQRPLRRGAKGPAVEALQRKLHVQVDGDFGPQTQAAVNRLKAEHGWPQDGVAGPRVLGALGLS